ncbi:DUF4214 domain-containing protein [Oleiphilus messinensis]|nr:DUF4214 domain-containing protein [Oleiphilus messinensis]
MIFSDHGFDFDMLSQKGILMKISTTNTTPEARIRSQDTSVEALPAQTNATSTPLTQESVGNLNVPISNLSSENLHHPRHSYSHQTLINEVTAKFRIEFSELAADHFKFHQLLGSVFGGNYDVSIAENIREQVSADDFNFLPNIQVVDNDVLGWRAGAYSAKTHTVFLNEDIPKEILSQVYIEEVGHHLDALMSKMDTRGDEGAVFRLLLNGESNPEELAQQRVQNDSGIIEIDGRGVEVEFNDGVYLVDSQTVSIDQSLIQLANNQLNFQFNQPNYQQSVVNNGINNTLANLDNVTSTSRRSGGDHSSHSSKSTDEPNSSNRAETREQSNQTVEPDFIVQLNTNGASIGVNWELSANTLSGDQRWATNDELISSAYSHFLGRAPDDPAFSEYLSQLNSGRLTQRQFVDAIESSSEAESLREANINPDIKFFLSEPKNSELAAYFSAEPSVMDNHR